jgi:Flp pilus assembly protein TadG
MMRSHLKRLLTDARGTSAIEFAIVGPVFMGCVVGMVYIGMMLFAEGSLQYAVEASARCAAVNTAVCSSSSTTQTYASNVYYGPSESPVFTSTSTTCGQKVTASATMTVNWVLGHANVPLSAAACFP